VAQEPQNDLDFDAATDDRGDNSDYWNSKVCKAPVTSPPPLTYQHSFFTDQMSSN